MGVHNSVAFINTVLKYTKLWQSQQKFNRGFTRRARVCSCPALCPELALCVLRRLQCVLSCRAIKVRTRW